MVAAPAGFEAEVASAAPAALEVEVVAGGATRSESVAAALACVETELVAVHDAARPLVAPEMIDALVERLVASPRAAGVIAATPLTDTVKRTGADGSAIERTESREGLWAAQTPQVFRTSSLRQAHAKDPVRLAAATDDSMLVEAAGDTVLIEPAPGENVKVTTPADLRLAEILLGER